MHRRVVFTFRNDTNIGPKHQRAQNYCQILRDIPVNELLDALTIDQLLLAVKKIFKTLGRVRTFNHLDPNQYSIERAVDLAECIARDFDKQLKKIVSESPVMQIPYQRYRTLQTDVNRL